MILIIAIVFMVLWVLGLGSSYTFGGYLHILIAAAVLLATYDIVQRRQVRGAL